MGLAKDPEAGVQAVQAAKVARLEAFNLARGIVAPSAVAAMEEEDEEGEGEPDEETAVEEEEEEEEAPPADEDEEEEEEEESGGIKVKPLLTPAKGDKLSIFEMWDNFTIKSVKMTDDDDDEDEDGMCFLYIDVFSLVAAICDAVISDVSILICFCFYYLFSTEDEDDDE